MRISARQVLTVTAVLGVMIGSVTVAQASMSMAVPPPTTDSGDLSTSPSTFFKGDTITVTANFADSQSGKLITFYKETSPGSGQYDSIGTKTASSSGNGSLTGYEINETQKVFASTSAGKATEVDTLTPKTVAGEEGVIEACFDRDDGELSILFAGKVCSTSQKPLSWNAQGIQGEKGDQGIQGIQGEKGEKGDKGDKGDPGPATGGALVSKQQSTDAAVLGTGVEVFSLTVPTAGKYAVSLSAIVENRNSNEDRQINCGIPGQQTGSMALHDVEGDDTYSQTISLTSWVERDAGGTIKFVCNSQLEKQVWVADVSMNALKVESITNG